MIIAKSLHTLASLVAVVILSVPSITYAETIKTAFGVTLGGQFDESMKISKFTRSNLFAGALHAYFQPSNPHPLLKKYSVWLTSETKTVVAIRAHADDRDHSFNYIGPKPPMNVLSEQRERERRDWGRQYYKSKKKLRFMFKSWTPKFGTIADQLDGIYGHLDTQDSLPNPRFMGRDNYTQERGFGGWKTYSDRAASIKLSLMCYNRVRLRKVESRAIWCSLILMYKLATLKEMLAKEAKDAQGL